MTKIMVGFFLLVFGLLMGCDTVSTTVNKPVVQETVIKPKQESKTDLQNLLPKEEKQKVCQVCNRKFPASAQTCPYDGATLEIIN